VSYMQDLLDAIAARKALENELAAELAEIKAELAKKSEPLLEAKKRENALRDSYNDAYLQCHTQRQTLLLAGVEVPPIPLPEALTVAWTDDLIEDGGAIDLELLADLGALEVKSAPIKKALKSGRTVPGFSLIKKPTLRIK